jgi:hypothetical protein
MGGKRAQEVEYLDADEAVNSRQPLLSLGFSEGWAYGFLHDW